MRPIYIDISDEVTTVIERIKGQPDEQMALIVPKGAILLQSIVNLKLIKKAAEDQSKEIILVTTDKIGRNLANQIGIQSLSKFDPESIHSLTESNEEESEAEPLMIDGVKIHRYYSNEPDLRTEEEEEEIEPIIPKSLIQNKPLPPQESPPTINKEEEAKEEPPASPPSPSKEKEEPEESPLPPPSDSLLSSHPEEVSEKITEPKITRSTVQPASKDDPVLPAHLMHPSKKPAGKRWKKALFFLLYLLLLGTVAAGSVSYVYLPKTTIVLAVPTESWTRDAIATAKSSIKQISDDGKELPAELVTAEVTTTLPFKATGSKDVGESAKGSATFYNNLGTAVSLPAGSRISVNNLFFTLDAPLAIPAATAKVNPDGTPVVTPGQINGNITAEAVGAASNLSDTTGSVVSPESKSYLRIISTTGGSSRQVTTVAATDISNAKTALTKQLQEQTKAQLQEKTKGRDLLFNADSDLFSLDSFSSSVQAGAEADSGSVTGKGVFKRLIVDKSLLEQALTKQVEKDQDGETRTRFRSLTVQKIDNSLKEQSMSLILSIQGVIQPVVNAEQIRAQLPGKRPATAQSLIQSIVPTATSTIQRSPNWWPNKNFPSSDKYIQVTVQYE